LSPQIGEDTFEGGMDFKGICSEEEEAATVKKKKVEEEKGLRSQR
jgi:hypothetical protein